MIENATPPTLRVWKAIFDNKTRVLLTLKKRDKKWIEILKPTNYIMLH